MKTRKTFFFAIAVVFFSLCAQDVSAQNDSGDKITPTPDPQSKYKVYVPKDLEDCFAELKNMLPQRTLKQMQEATEDRMIQ